MSTEDVQQNAVETANALFISMYRTIEALFTVPLNQTIFELAHKWEEMPSGLHQRKGLFIDNPHFTTVISVEGLELTEGTSFEYDDEISIDEDWLDSYYRHDRIYTYGDLVSTFFAITQELYFLRGAVAELDKDMGDNLAILLSMISANNFYRNLRSAEPRNSAWLTTMFSQLAPIATLVDALTDVDE